jgi:proline dehydrogenase
MDFNNTALAFQSMSDGDLRRSQLLFGILKYPWLVRLGKPVVEGTLWLRLPIQGLVKKTVFSQFVGGENIADCAGAIEKLWKYRIESILDYSVEGKSTEADFQRGMEITLQTMAAHTKFNGLSLGVFKMTGLSSIELLEKISAQEPLTAEEAASWDRAMARFRRLAAYAQKEGLRIMIDAEESWIQPAIDQTARTLMAEFNRERAVVFTTVQLYRTGRVEAIEEELQAANTAGYKVGIKIVRGAYMEKERERAEKQGYPSPIQPDKASTDRDFNRATALLIEAVGTPTAPTGHAVVIGTHNEDSTQLAADCLAQGGWKPGEAPIWMAQLYGMSDHISHVAAHEGHKVAKYLPFGPVREVLPYLFRRAEENTSVAGQTGRELSNLQTEIRRRRAARKA